MGLVSIEESSILSVSYRPIEKPWSKAFEIALIRSHMQLSSWSRRTICNVQIATPIRSILFRCLSRLDTQLKACMDTNQLLS